MRERMQHRMMLIVGGLMFAFTQAVGAAAPTAIANNTGYSAACYDFNDYIPATESPVIGGWALITPPPGMGKYLGNTVNNYLVHPFGKICTGVALSQNTDTYNRYTGRLAKNSTSYGWYVAGPAWFDNQTGCTSETCGYDWKPLPESLFMACPSNSAPIKVSNYVRSDGGQIITPVHSFDVSAANTAAWLSPGSYPAGTRLETFVCVKTDTY